MLIGIDASRAAVRRLTGTEAYAAHLIRALVEPAAARGYTLRLYFNQEPDPQFLPQAAHVEVCIIPFPRLWTHWRLANELRQRPPQVFFTPAHVVPFSFRGCSVATVHDLAYEHFPEAYTRRQLAYLRLSTRSNARNSARVIADSQATRQDLVKQYAIDEAKIDVIYPGLDPDLDATEAPPPSAISAVLERYGIAQPYLLTMATLQPRKNLGRLVEAFGMIDLPHQLVLAGKSGWLATPILREIERLPANRRERVRLPGYVDHADKRAIVSGAAAVLYPSLYEGFGFPILEGQACGIPVLAAKSSSLPEVAGQGALLVNALNVEELAAGIVRITGDSALRAELVRQGRKNVGRFSWQTAASAVLDTLERAAAEHRRRT
jgi:glycosyltransferase involved in cell wall biosynthesis